MAIIKNPITVVGGGGGDVVNGIIEQYKASTGTIAANTFVEFVNNVGTNTDKKLSTTTFGGSANIIALALDSTHIFIAHGGDGMYSSTDGRLYGIVCTISGTTITPGTDTRLSTTSYGNTDINATILDSTHVFITHGNQNSGSITNYLYGIVCTISGTTITPGKDTNLSTTRSGGHDGSPVALDSTHVFVAHRGDVSSSDKNFLYGIVCTISGKTITPGTDTKLSDTKYGGSYEKGAIALDSTHVFVAHNGESLAANGRLHGIVCTISGTTITPSTDTKLSAGAYSGQDISAARLDSAHIFISHAGDGDTGSEDSRLYGIVCTISGTTITPGTDTKLSDTKYGHNSSATVLDSTHVFVAHNGEGSYSGSNCRPYGIVCTIKGTLIIPSIDTKLSSTTYGGYQFSAVVLDSTHVFVAHSGEEGPLTASRLYGVETNINVGIKPASLGIHGLTKTACTTSTAGDVWVLNN